MFHIILFNHTSNLLLEVKD